MASDQELYQQYLKETGQAKPDDSALYEQYLKETGQADNKGILSKAADMGGSVLSGIGTAVDYTAAPMRQALMAPARISKGEIADAVTAPFLQLLSGPSSAPSSSQVAEAYGVPKDKQVSPIVEAQPMYAASSYENNPLPNDPENVTIHPSAQAGGLIDLAAGEGLGLMAKGAGKVSQGARGLNEMLTLAKEKPNAAAITESANALGVKPTAGMLSESPYVKNMESSLEQSPSIAGALIRKETAPVRNAIKGTANDVFADIPRVQPSDVGAKVKEGFSQIINDRLAPLRESYDNIRESTGNISVAPKAKFSVARNIENIDTLKSSPASSTLKTIAEDLRNVKNADELKKLRSNIGSGLSSKDLDPREKAALSAAYSKISNLENNSIMRSAIENAGDTDEGKAIAKGLITQLKDTNKQWGGLIEEIGDISLNAGTGKNLKTVTQFVNKLDEIPDEKIVDTFFKTNNRAQLQRIENSFPDQFKAMREAKLDNIRRQVETGGEVSPKKLLNVVKGIEPDTQKILFGPEATEKIKHMETVINAVPDKVGPSGTPQGMEWLDFLSLDSLAAQPSRLMQYGLLKNYNKVGEKTKNVLNAVGKMNPDTQTASRVGGLIGIENNK